MAVTRAMGLLIIVGCAEALKDDKHWRELLRYYRNNNAVIGEPFTSNLNEPEVSNEKNAIENIEKNLQTLSLK